MKKFALIVSKELLRFSVFGLITFVSFSLATGSGSNRKSATSTDVFATGNILTADVMNGMRIDCGNIVGGSDSDYCSDSEGSGGGSGPSGVVVGGYTKTGDDDCSASSCTCPAGSSAKDIGYSTGTYRHYLCITN